MLLKLLENIIILAMLIIFIIGIGIISYWRGATQMKEFTLDNLSVTINGKTHKCSVKED